MNPVSGSPPSLHTVDDLIRLRAQDSNQQPLLALSASEHGLTDFEYFTGHDLDRLTDVATKLWMSRGLGPAVSSSYDFLWCHEEFSSISRGQTYVDSGLSRCNLQRR
jgi:hypothetical protein